MLFRIFILVLCVILFNGKLFSQRSFSIENYDNKNPLTQLTDLKDPTFEEVRSIYEEHWNNADTAHPAGWKQFKRWEYFWETRLLPDGRFPKGELVYDEWTKFEQTYQSKNPKVQSSKWELLGPVNIPAEYNGTRTQGLGRINVIRFDPQNSNTLWAGSSTGGVWKSTDLGKTWQGFPFTNFLSSGISDIAIYPKNSSVIYLATGDDNAAYALSGYYSVGLLRSYYGGLTWEVTNLTKQLSDKFIISRVLVHPEDYNHVIVGTSTGVMKSLDGGKTWTNPLQGVFIKDMEFMPDNPNIINAVSFSYSSNASFFRSTDGGDNWESTHSLPGSNRISITVSPSNPNKIWAVASRSGYNSFHSFLISVDQGATWEVYLNYSVHDNILGRYSGKGDDALVGQGHYDLCIAVNPTNENEIYVGGINIWKSIDGAGSFERISNWTGGGNLPFLHADHHDLQFKPNTTDLYASHDGGLSVSSNQGKSWTDLTNGMSITQYYRIGMSKTNQNLIIGGCQDNGTNMYSDDGWKHLRAGDGMEAIIHPTNDNMMFMSYYHGQVYKSQDKGKSWSKSVDTSDVHEHAAWVTPYIIDPSNPDVMYIGFQNIYKSTTRGNLGSWTKVSNIGGQTFKSMAISPNNSNYVYAATTYELFASFDAGKTWESKYRASNPITYIAVDPNNPRRIWLTFGSYTANAKVIEINDGEVTNISGNLPNVPINCIIYQNNSPDRLYIGTDIGVFVSDYNSAYWESYGDDMPKVIVTELEIFEPDNKLIAATYGRGIWKTDLMVCNLPQPNVMVIGPTEFCQGDSVRLEAQEGYESYLWSNGQTDRVIYAKTSGAYTVRIFDKDGCYSNSKAVIVNVKEVNEVNILNSGNIGFCPGGDVKLTATFGFTIYLWSNGLKGRVITVSEPGVYWVEATANNGCSRKSADVEVAEFQSPPKPVIDRIGNTLMAVSQNAIISKCDWFLNGEKIAESENNSFLMSENGIYSVIIIDSNGCISEESDDYDLILGIEDKNDNFGITVFPNPNEGEYQILINCKNESEITVEVTNILGETVYSMSGNLVSAGENIIDISMKDVPQGIYFLKIHTLDIFKTIKIIKK